MRPTTVADHGGRVKLPPYQRAGQEFDFLGGETNIYYCLIVDQNLNNADFGRALTEFEVFVPEPSVVGLLVVGGAALWFRRRS